MNGELYDLTRPLEADAKLQILTSKNPEALEVYRHSTAHLLAAAVLELFPETKLGIGPPTETGFYYDFDRDTPFTPEDLEKIEAKMWEIAGAAISRTSAVYTPKAEGLAKYAQMGERMKCELIDEKADEIFSEYTLGRSSSTSAAARTCPRPSEIKAFKLLSIAGAYWKGDEKNQQLQRIYGTAFFTQKELDEYLKRLEEAKKRDHRKLGQELDLFSIQELAGPGLDLLPSQGRHHPQAASKTGCATSTSQRGYSLVYTPHIARARPLEDLRPLRFYAENMFTPMSWTTPSTSSSR